MITEDKPITFSREKRLAMLLQAIDDAERDFVEVRTEYKDRITRLLNQAYALRQDILNGQDVLPLEPISENQLVSAIAEKTVEAINGGALDKNGLKVTAEVHRQ